MYIHNDLIPIYIPIKTPYAPIISRNFSSDKIENNIDGYLSSVYDSGDFLKAIYKILAEKDGFCLEGADCYYAEMNSPDPREHFEGVRFELGGMYDPYNQIHVSEEVVFLYFKEACEKFMELHPEKEYSDFLNPILENWVPLPPDSSRF